MLDADNALKRLLVDEAVFRIPCRPSTPVEGLGMHKHRCSGCGTVWAHADALPEFTTPDEFEQAHSCPSCNKAGVYDKAFQGFTFNV